MSSPRALVMIAQWAAVVALGATAAAREPYVVEFLTVGFPSGGADGQAVTVSGFDKQLLAKLSKADIPSDRWTSAFAVRVNADAELPPVLGEYRVVNQTLCFQPRFAFRPGIRYVVSLSPIKIADLAGDKRKDLADLGNVSTEFQIAKPASKPTARVECVYPTADTVPENQLKLYIHFTAPMSRGEAYSRVRLVDGAGNEVPHPFLELDEELWDPAGKRFTLFFDPGRIKREVGPREQVGPPLRAGETYTLIIDRQWRDAAGEPLVEEFRKTFRVGPPDTTLPDPKRWKIEPPAAGERSPLVVTFPEPLDQAQLLRLIEVVDPAGHPVSGTIRVEQQETRWELSPDKAWQAGKYHLRTQETLEDLAGNSIGRRFEVDIFERVDKDGAVPTTELGFEVDLKK